MDGMLDRVGHLAWMHCWQVTLLIVLVMGFVWCFGRSRPHLASVLWLLVIVKCLTPPIWSSPSGVFCWLQPVTEIAATGTLHVTDSAPSYVRRDDDELVVQMSPDDENRPASIWPSPSTGPIAKSDRLSTLSWQRVLTTALAISWFAGLLTCLLFMARRWQTCWRQIRTDQVEPTSDLSELLRELQQRLGICRPTQLLITSSAVGPAVVGLWRPTIVLPLAVIENKRPEDIELLLAHELVHIRRGDLWVAMLQLMVQCLWWFHPLVRWANQGLTRETERSCDEEVIGRLGCSSLAYARSLLNVLELKQQLQPIPTFPGVRPVDVTKQRLERIMQLGQGCRRRTPWWCWAIMAALALITLPGAALLVRGKDPPTKNLPTLSAGLLISTAAIGEDLSAAGPQAEMTTVTYEVHDLVEKLETEIVDDADQAARYLEGVLRSALNVDVTQKRELQFGWHDGRLVVRTTKAGQRVIAEQIEIYRQSGFVQYVFEVRLLQASAGLQHSVKADWQAIQPKADSELGRFDVDFDDRTSGHMVSTVNRQTPVIATLLDEPQMRIFMTQAQADKDMNFITAPKITAFNGQSVRIEQLERRPFVVAVKEAKKGVFQPEIRIVDVGSKLRLRARGLKNGKIKVDFARAESEITKVDIAAVSPTNNVQVPQVAVNRLQTQVEMLPNQTYVVGGLESLHDPEKSHVWLLVTVRQINEADLREQEEGPKKKDAAVRSVGHVENQGVQPELITKVYNVADLAISLAQIRSVGFNNQINETALRVSLLADGQLKAQATKQAELNGDDLIKLITETIEPDMWADVGGEGTVEFVPQQSSLLVSQYERVHERINDLLGELRRLQQTTVVLSLKQVWIPTAEWKKLTADPQFVATIADIDQRQGFQSLSAEQMAKLLKHDAQQQARATKTVTHNGQPVLIEAAAREDGKLPIDGLRTLHLLPVISGDWSCVRLSMAPQTNPEPDTKAPVFCGPVVLSTDTTLVVDLDRTDWQRHESKFVTPARNGSGEKSTTKAGYRRLLTVTADVFTMEGGVAKRAKNFSLSAPK